MSSLDIIQQGHDEYAAKGKGLLTHMESFDTFFSLKLAYLIFAAAEQLSINLQYNSYQGNQRSQTTEASLHISAH